MFVFRTILIDIRSKAYIVCVAQMKIVHLGGSNRLYVQQTTEQKSFLIIKVHK